MAKKAKTKVKTQVKAKVEGREPWTKEHVRELKAQSKSKTPVVEIAEMMGRTPLALRQKAMALGLKLGHRR
jgi:hypothetical protein